MEHGTQMTLIIQIYTDILILNTIDHQSYSIRVYPSNPSNPCSFLFRHTLIFVE